MFPLFIKKKKNLDAHGTFGTKDKKSNYLSHCENTESRGVFRIHPFQFHSNFKSISALWEWLILWGGKKYLFLIPKSIAEQS